MYILKYRLYPSASQTAFLNKNIGCARFVYNWGLERQLSYYQENHKKLTYAELCRELTELKKERPWLQDVISQTLVSSLRNLETAYNRFFKKQSASPKFHSRHQRKQSINAPQGLKILDKNHLYLPKIGRVRAVFHRPISGNRGGWTVIKTRTGKFFICITCRDDIKKARKTDDMIGIDLGIKTYATCSNGLKIDNPKWLRDAQKRLAILQRRASKKAIGSQNRKKANLKVAKLHEKIVNQREDWQHKWSAKLVSENQVICLEDLSVSNMLKNHKLAKSIQECAWSNFVSKLEYKAEWYGTQIVKIGRFEPSSKLCPCGYINKGLTLAERAWTCPRCKATHDRDLLASCNILSIGLKLLSGRGTPVEPVEVSASVEPVKQESDLQLAF